jgi:hypothetical protein
LGPFPDAEIKSDADLGWAHTSIKKDGRNSRISKKKCADEIKRIVPLANLLVDFFMIINF